MFVRRATLMGIFGAIMLPWSSVFAATYTVKAGETFYSISRRYKVSVSALMAANGMKDPRKLKIGQKLIIPGKKSGVSKKSSSSHKVATRATQYYPRRSRSLRVVVDPGHGGRDIGASWYGVNESSLNMKVARKVKAGLIARGYPVTMTRTSDYFISLRKRAQIANRYRNAIFVSIHFNATRNTSVSGAETYYKGRKSRHLAKCIQSQLVKRLRVRNRGVRLGNYAVLVGTKIPSVLVECGFISNSYERSRCKTSSFQTAAAKAIVSGVERYDRVY